MRYFLESCYGEVISRNEKRLFDQEILINSCRPVIEIGVINLNILSFWRWLLIGQVSAPSWPRAQLRKGVAFAKDSSIAFIFGRLIVLFPFV